VKKFQNEPLLSVYNSCKPPTEFPTLAMDPQDTTQSLTSDFITSLFFAILAEVIVPLAKELAGEHNARREKSIACVRRYKKAKGRYLTDDAKAFIYRWKRLEPFAMYTRFMLVHVKHTLYAILQQNLYIRSRLPEERVAFKHVAHRKVDVRRLNTLYPGAPNYRCGMLYGLDRKSLKKTRNCDYKTADTDIVTIVRWTLCISPFRPMKIHSVLVKSKDGGVGDWIIFMCALREMHGDVSIYSLTKNRSAYHFFSERVAHWFAKIFLPDVD
jgi:hypothetical protein